MADEAAGGDLMGGFGGRAAKARAAAPAARRGEGAGDAVAFLTGLAERGQQMTSAAGLNTARAAMMDAVRLKARASEPAQELGVAEWMVQPPMSEAEWIATYAPPEAWETYFAELAAQGPEAFRRAVTPAKSAPGQLTKAPPSGAVSD